MISASSVVKQFYMLDACTFGHYEFQDESIDDAPKHRAVIGGGGR